MPCVRPLLARRVDGEKKPKIYKSEAVPKVLRERWGEDSEFDFRVACNSCIGCMLDRRRGWAIRSIHEATLHERNCFLTLTLDAKHQELAEGHLVKAHYQLFMKRWREQRRRDWRKAGNKGSPPPVSYIFCGEYGSRNLTPHYHALVFGANFMDSAYDISTTKGGHTVFHARELDHYWGMGYALIGDVSFDSASYVASYTTKKAVAEYMHGAAVINKQTGEVMADTFVHQSKRPAIAKRWLPKYGLESVYQNDLVQMKDELKLRPPKYYDAWLAEEHPERWEEVREQRRQHVSEKRDDYSDFKLSAKEKLFEARMKLSLQREKI